MKKSLGFLLLASITVVPSLVMAGFQFTAPIEQQSAPVTTSKIINSAPQMPSMPAIQVQKEPLVKQQMRTPIIQTTARPSQPTYAPPSQPAISTNTIATSVDDLAVGFGKDLPLATALKQVIPDGYTYVMDEGIPIGSNVSWNGGQSWPIVLNDMVSPMGLNTQIDGKIIRITQPSSPKNSQPAMQNYQPTAPIQLASASNYNQQNTMLDAPDVLVQPTSPATVDRREPVISMPWEVKPVKTAPTNILGPQLTNESIVIRSTEPEDIKELEKSVVPDVTQGQWIAQSGGSLKTVLESWTNLEGVDLFWSADYDYPLAGDVNISGNFEEAVEALLKGFSGATPKPTGRLHPNLPHGPAVLVIEAAQIIN